MSTLEARRLQEEEERRQREEEERRAQEERERLQAIEDARFAKETAALDVWLVHQKDCFDEWKAEQWKEIQVITHTRTRTRTRTQYTVQRSIFVKRNFYKINVL